MSPRHFPLLACAAIPLLTGCPTEPPPRAKEPVVVEDEWSRTAPSKEWLHATADFSGDHKAECAQVLTWVQGEETCKGSLCEHGRNLAAEWIDRCPKYADAESMASAKTLRDTLTKRAGEKPTACGTEFDAMLREECGEDKTCQAPAQKWATRCAKTEGSPLLVRLLERMIERKLPEPGKVSLDARSCDELRADVMEAGKCKDRFTCTDALPRVENYKARCESDDARPTITVAVAELAVIVGADKPATPIAISAKGPEVQPGDVPVVLADGSGGVLLMCEQRASDFERYLSARKECQSGRMVVARAFKGEHGREVRVGSLDFPDEATFSARYPTIATTKEIELREKTEATALEAELAKAVATAKLADGGQQAAKLLLKAVNDHASGLLRLESLRAELAAHDAELVPALVELGKAKIAVTKRRVPAGDLAGLLTRGATRAFADIGADGAVQVGGFSKASRLDTAAILPRAMAGYLDQLKKGRLGKLDKKTVSTAKAAGMAAAVSCGEAEKKFQGAKGALINCSFGLDKCDEGMLGGLAKGLEEARAKAEGAYHELDLARTGGAASEAGELDKAAAEAGCKAPWW